MQRLKKKIENKTCFVFLSGASLEEFRRHYMNDFVKYDACWCGINFFTPVKQHILDSIGKKFTFILDISGILNIVPYEQQCRIPRVENYLEYDTGLFVTSYEVKRNFAKAGREDIFKKYNDKIIFIEQCVDLNLIHNSLMAYLYVLTYCNVKDVYLFGCDGYNGEYVEKNAILSYFCPKDVRSDLLIAYNGAIYLGLPSDTYTFNGSFKQAYLDYCTDYKLIPKQIKVVNKDSFITIFPRLTFKEAIKELEEDNGQTSNTKHRNT